MAAAVVATASVAETEGADIVLTLPVGTSTGHVVVAAYSLGGQTDYAMSETSATWTELWNLFADGTVDDNQAAYLKVMGDTPDSTVTFAGTGSSGAEGAAICIVCSGIDTGTPLDVAVQTATATSGGQIDSPSVTTTTDGALVIPIGSISRDDTTPTVPTGYDDLVYGIGSGGADTTVMAAAKTVATAGAEDPAGWGFPFQANRAWCAGTVALRPAAGGEPSTFIPAFAQGSNIVITP